MEYFPGIQPDSRHIILTSIQYKYLPYQTPLTLYLDERRQIESRGPHVQMATLSTVPIPGLFADVPAT